MSSFEIPGKVKFAFNGIATLCILGGFGCVFLGYKLFTIPIVEGNATLKAHFSMFGMDMTGTWPGLFFMAFGGVIFIVGLICALVPNLFGRKKR